MSGVLQRSFSIFKAHISPAVGPHRYGLVRAVAHVLVAFVEGLVLNSEPSDNYSERFSRARNTIGGVTRPSAISSSVPTDVS